MTEHKNIASALASAQQEMGKALKDSANPHFKSKYADLASVKDACLSALNKNGIAVIQPLEATETGEYFVRTTFLHGSGETLSCPIPLILGKRDMQGLGSAITYARRFGLMSLAGIAPEDDDGNAAAATFQNNQRDSKPQNPMGNALGDAWKDAVLDSLPEDASPSDKAGAFAAAIIRDFASKKGLKALNSEWDRRAKMIDSFKDRFPDLHDQIVDAFEMRKNDIAPAPEGIAAE